MASSSQATDFTPEPDLHPLYPVPAEVARLLSTSSGLTPTQKSTLVSHCMTRACVFADLLFFQYILHDPQAHPYLDLNTQDEDGLVYVSVIILGFGSESDRDVEREECVRLLINEGADVNLSDKAGWTPLHHAAVVAPPTLISYLLTHGCSPLSVTKRNMTALDIVTAYAVIPGREDVALFLEEAMKGEGWQGSKMTVQRREFDEKVRRDGKLQNERQAITKILDLNDEWWQSRYPIDSSDVEGEDDTEGEEQSIYTPPIDFSSMLVFSPATLPGILESLITNYQPSSGDSTPANALYMLARFACLTCDHTWLEELVMGATDDIEDAAFARPDDLTCTVFWLYNCTVWLHLMRCDSAINETCELVGSFDMIEEVINTAYVLIIRVAERRIDKLIDTAILDFSPAEAELDQVQFESEWSLFRFSTKKRTSQSVTPSSTTNSFKSTRPGSPTSISSRPTSPTQLLGSSNSHNSKNFTSLRSTVTRARGASTASIHNIFTEGPPPTQTPRELILFLSALHTLLIEGGVNPAIITQLWSQVMYWTAAEAFNRILTRKRYLCRSRALQIGMNLSVVEEWISEVGLPRGVEAHFNAVRELLHWLQCLSSMDDFSNLIATIQTLKNLNPLQMRRAVRDYKYEVNELRMSDDCSQYLAQLQKDWERQRVRMGVEALRKEITDRDKDYDDDSLSVSTQGPDDSSAVDKPQSIDEASVAQDNIDLLFDITRSKSEWNPTKPPEVLGELLESRYMLPLVMPSDPRMLAAVPGRRLEPVQPPKLGAQLGDKGHARNLSTLGSNSRRVLDWKMGRKQMRKIGIDVLDYLDGSSNKGRWVRREDSNPVDDDGTESVSSTEDGDDISGTGQSGEDVQLDRPSHLRLTRLSRVASRSRQGRC